MKGKIIAIVLVLLLCLCTIGAISIGFIAGGGFNRFLNFPFSSLSSSLQSSSISALSSSSVTSVVTAKSIYFKKIPVDASTSTYTISGSYVQMSDSSSVVLANSLNSDIKTKVQVRINEFKKSLDGLTIEKLHSMGLDKYTLDVKYTVLTSYNGIVSLYITYSDYTGGAHGNTDYQTYNYSISDDKMYTIDNIFDPSSSFLSTLSVESKTAIAGKVDPTDLIAGGISALKANFKYILITSTGVKLIFPPYQIAPYSNGTIEADIPLYKIKSLVKDSALKTFWGI